MRARLLAILILLAVIGIPVALYWFFLVKNTSSVAVHFGSGAAHVKLEGSFSYGFLPLADKVLKFEKECLGNCLFAPIPPAKYQLSILPKNDFEAIHDTFELQNGQALEQTYTLKPISQKNVFTLPPAMSEDEKIILKKRLESSFSGSIFMPLGRDFDTTTWVMKLSDTSRELMTLSGTELISLKVFPFIPDNTIFDWKHGSILLLGKNNFGVLYDMKTRQSLESQFPEVVSGAIYDAEGWKIFGSENGYYFKNSTWQKNPRFSSSIDVSDEWRVGYIHPTDTEKLQISNYSPTSGGVLIALSRRTGEVREIATNISLKTFSVVNNTFFWEEENGATYTTSFN